MQQMQQLQQVAKAGGDVAPLAKVLPEEARAIANAEAEQYGHKRNRKKTKTT